MRKYLLAILILVLLGAAYFWFTRPFVDHKGQSRSDAYFVVLAIDVAGSDAARHGAPDSVDTIPELLAYFDANPDVKLEPDYRAMLEGEGEYYRQTDFSWTYSQDGSFPRVNLVRIRANPQKDAPAWSVAMQADEPGKKQLSQWTVVGESD